MQEESGRWCNEKIKRNKVQKSNEELPNKAKDAQECVPMKHTGLECNDVQLLQASQVQKNKTSNIDAYENKICFNNSIACNAC